jgi:integrase
MPKLYTEEGIKKGAYSYCQRDRRYLKATWWYLSLMIANSGIRPSECIRLRHQDIKLIESDGEYFTVINVSASNSKTGKQRNMVCRDGHKTYERYLEYKKEIEYRFNKSDIKETDWLFPATGRTRSYDEYKTTQVYNDLARNNFKRLGIHTQEVTLFKGRTNNTVKVYFSLYSFRSWYITQRLKNRLSIFTLSKQVGSSVATIQRYYEKTDLMYFKDEMIKHYKYDYDLGTVDDDIKSHAVEWR